jgi:phosphoribosylanthranilate isomerase
MSLKTIVKVSKVNNLSDARYCAGMGVEMIGFEMNDSNFEAYKEIRGWLAGVQIVGETDSHSIGQIIDLKEKYLPDVLQVSDWQNINEIKKIGLPIVLKIDLQEPDLEQILQTTGTLIDYVLLDNSDEFAQLDTDTLNRIQAIANDYTVLLGFGLDANNVLQTLEDLTLEGISLNGTDEIRPGFKDFGELMDILEVLDQD